MSWIESLCWTSRTAVCDRLVQYLLDTPPSPSLPEAAHGARRASGRSQAARLLMDLAGPEYAPALRPFLFDPQEEAVVRVDALGWFCDQRAWFNASELQQIVSDPVLRTVGDGYRFDHWLLPLFDSALEHRVVLEYIWAKSPVERTRLLSRFSRVDAERDQRERIAPRLWAQLYDLWLSRDRVELEEAGAGSCWTNLDTAFQTRNRLASQALLRDYWRQGTPELRRQILRWLQPDLADKQWDLPEDETWLRELLADCAANDPVLYSKVLKDLDLPLAFLLEHLGPEALLHRIIETIEAANQLHRERRWKRLTEGRSGAMERAYFFLRDWPDPSVDARIQRMLCRPDPSPWPRRMLFWVLLDRDRDRAHAVAVTTTTTQ